MGRDVKLERLYDADLIRDFMIQDELWERISEDGLDKDDFEVPIVDEFHWLGFFADDKMVGLFFIHPETLSTCQIHFSIAKQYRRLYSLRCALAGFTYLLDETHFSKFNTHVPACYPDVENFVVKLGFTKEGTNRMSINKNNTLIDQYYYGITRGEIANFMNNLVRRK
jgi:RimJ/RimL family protein N-acetyltransferase